VIALVMCARPSASRPGGGKDVGGRTAHEIAKQVGLFGKRGKDAADGVVGRYLFQPSSLSESALYKCGAFRSCHI